MSREVIATIKLAQGRVGFYDELSRIHLSIGAPTAHVLSGTNCARLRRAVRDGVIKLIDGTLGGNIPPFKVVKVGDKYKLAANVEEENKPVFVNAEETLKDAVAPVQGVEVEDGGKAEEAVPEEIKKDEPVKAVEEADAAVEDEAPVEEVKEKAPAAEEVAEETSAEEEEKTKKKGGRKATKKSKE